MKNMIAYAWCWIGSASFLLGVGAQAEDWAQFRGPTGQGYAAQTATIPSEWTEDRHIVWKTPINGTGWSSPVLQDGQIWMTYALNEATADPETDERLQDESPIPRMAVDDLTLHAICLDQATGEVIYDLELLREERPDPIHTMNSFASPTPVLESGHVYCHFGTNGTVCVDTRTGAIIWTNRELRIKHGTGAGSSPILWKNLFIVHCDGMDEQYVVALDKHTGQVVWKTNRSGKMNANPEMQKAFATPLIVPFADGEALLSPAANWLYAYDPADGTELWRHEYGRLGFSNVPRPVLRGDLLYICTGFMPAELQALRLDLDHRAAEPQLAWSYGKQVPHISSPLVVGSELYFVSDQGGVLTCLDAENGELVWRERLRGSHTASPVLAEGKIVLPNCQGETHVIQPGRQFTLIATNGLAAGALASPAVLDDSLYLRTKEAVYRIR